VAKTNQFAVEFWVWRHHRKVVLSKRPCFAMVTKPIRLSDWLKELLIILLLDKAVSSDQAIGPEPLCQNFIKSTCLDSSCLPALCAVRYLDSNHLGLRKTTTAVRTPTGRRYVQRKAMMIKSLNHHHRASRPAGLQHGTQGPSSIARSPESSCQIGGGT